MIITRLLLAYASLSVAFVCGERALGVTPQHIFGPETLWLWWLPVVGWVGLANGVLARGAE